MSEPIVVLLKDCPVSFLGKPRGTLVLRFDAIPKSQTELGEAAERALGFPLLSNDEARRQALALWATAPFLPEEFRLPINPLQLGGSDEGLLMINRVLEANPLDADSIEKVGHKLLQTLHDGERHSFMTGIEAKDKMIAYFVRSHPGRYSHLASGWHNQIAMNLLLMKENNIPPQKLGAMLCLDYFIEDANRLEDRELYLFLAVNWFPFDLKVIPPGCETALIQKEMVSDSTWFDLQQFYKAGKPILRVFDREPVTTEGKRTPQIFLCHNSANKPVVRQLADYLNRLGIDAWLDEWEIQAGDSLRRSIGTALEKSRFVGVIITPAFLKSEWCMNELDQALAREQRQGGKVVIPMLFEKAVAPPFIESRLHLDFGKGFFTAFIQLCGILYNASPKRIADILAEKPPTSLADVRSMASQIGWENYSFIERSEFEKLRNHVARLGFTSIEKEFVVTSEIMERLRNTGFDVSTLNRLID